jgi:class 3 adenylate cyclase/tetratricopeptide (TPR) repeat protein
MICRGCGAENGGARKFCLECGSPLTGMCSSCGAANEPSAKFCGDCGIALTTAVAPQRESPIAERRVVSVLFADLVGFTSLSASRDAEETRELLSRYFDSARRLVERYGGTVEKFIGDAVMAVWGAPTANEDDAERAVRTALDLVAAVSGLADELGLPGLRLRVGILTGEAAVTVGVEQQGMVAGDLVNTASRVQSAAAPGVVLVGETTRRASEASIAYEDAGLHELKGKEEPLQLYRALRVIAARRGEGRSVGLEPPFVGRDREFRLVTDLFHASAEERRARLVSVSGIAGIGKSRLSWEFEKHVDGLAFEVLWHRGRCLAYGEGVAFSALAEMVRMRARIAEDDAPEIAVAKLSESLAGLVADPDERTFLEPRLAHLLGLADRSAPDKEDIFSAWRLFFERMAEQYPVVLVFEDVQWADAALLDFVEYLLDWSRSFPIYILSLARPELAERRPTFGSGQRDYSSLVLDPLKDTEIDELLGGLAPGLPDELRARIVERADGVPLYAVETVRMLLDRGLLERDGDAYRPTGAVGALDVPETLQALVAARLDGLDSAERRLLDDAAVLGKTFTRAGLTALSGLDEQALAPLLQSLLRKEVLTMQNDPLSPERGQLSFVQDLLRHVAYETLSLRERKSRHLATAAYLIELDSEEETAALVAAHYLDAYRAGPADDDSLELKVKARKALARAGERAISLAAAGEASRYFAQAAELADEPLEHAAFLERAGRAAAQDGQNEPAHAAYAQAIALLEELGDRRTTARVEARLADLLRWEGRVDEALVLMQAAYDGLVGGALDPDLALVAAQLSRLAYFAGKPEAALEPIEVALEIAEALQLPEALAEALNTKGCLLYRRPHESEALLHESLKIALEHDLTEAVLRAQFNLSGLALEHDRLEDARSLLGDSLALARRRGDRSVETYNRGQLAEVLVLLGEWDAALDLLAATTDLAVVPSLAVSSSLLTRVRIVVGRGEVTQARLLLEEGNELRTSSDRQESGSYAMTAAVVARAEGRPDEALRHAQMSAELWGPLRQMHYMSEALVESVEAALDLDDIGLADELVTAIRATPAIERRASLTAHEARLQGKLDLRHGRVAGGEFDVAAAGFRVLEMPFWLAVTLVEQAEGLNAAGHAYDPELVSEAAEIFSRLKAVPWLERAAQLAGDRPRERRAPVHAAVTPDIRQDRRTSVHDASS